MQFFDIWIITSNLVLILYEPRTFRQTLLLTNMLLFYTEFQLLCSTNVWWIGITSAAAKYHGTSSERVSADQCTKCSSWRHYWSCRSKHQADNARLGSFRECEFSFLVLKFFRFNLLHIYLCGCVCVFLVLLMLLTIGTADWNKERCWSSCRSYCNSQGSTRRMLEGKKF